MSRHRMVRNLTEDDYYDDYDDDYYDDDYYEEDDYYQPPPKKTTTPARSGASAKNKNQTQKKSTTVSTANIAVAGKTATTASVGVTKPPPGWGKPSSSGTSKGTRPAAATPTTAPPGITKPPVGWGKPSSDPASTAAAPALKKPQATAPLPTANVSQKYQPKPLPPILQTALLLNTKNSKNGAPITSKNKSSSGGLKSQLSMVVLGHVDAGKSTLMGQLLVQTGQINKRDAQKLVKNGGNMSWFLDENESERARGVTMEIGTKGMSTHNHDIVILDAPGHADFVPIMITGAANADTAILVVDAVTGEFEAGFSGGGQTKEHILLAKGLGVSQIIVAINKLDVEGWKQDRYQQIQAHIQDYLLQQQFKKPRIQFVPLSGLTGENVRERNDSFLTSWYPSKAPTLWEAIDAFKPANRSYDKPFRFIVTDMYAEGKGVVARGRVVQGFLKVGEKVVVLPIGDSAGISRLEHVQQPPSDQPERLSLAIAGDTVELVLTGIDPMRVSVGNLVVEPSGRPRVVQKAKAKLLVMEDLAIPIIRGAQVLFHMHSLDIPAVLTKLVALTKRDGSVKKERPRALTSGASAIVEFTLSDKIVMEPFQECRALGRFVLRRGGDTIAVGVVDQLID